MRDRAIEQLRKFIVHLPPTDPDRPMVVNHLAGAYVNRGNAKDASRTHGPDAAIVDYDAAIAMMEALRRDLHDWEARLQPSRLWPVDKRGC